MVGRTFDEAIELLRDYEAGYYEEHSDTVPAGTVISQAVEGNMVVITVSLGPE
uniref:PASTA domain-containing protein n=1 Tax=Muribaculaceae bacterium Z82 TaxID=2304548 RepID=A0A7C9JPT4_9BACT